LPRKPPPKPARAKRRTDPLDELAASYGVEVRDIIDTQHGLPVPAEAPFAAEPIALVEGPQYEPRRPRKRADLYEPREDLRDVDLRTFMTRVSPGVVSPEHFGVILDAFEQIRLGKTIRIVFSAPCQHGKSTLVRHGCAYIHHYLPWHWIQYVTYEQSFSEVNARDIRRIELEAGVKISDEHNTIKGWTINHELPDRMPGEFIATSVDGRSSGMKANLLMIDDPFKGIEDAFNAARRDVVYQTLKYVWMPRFAPNYSGMLTASRFHEDDLSGRLIRDGWDHVRLPAINDSGEALCPWGPDPREPRTLAFLEELRYGPRGADGVRRGGMGEHAWSALMMGAPLPPDAGLFKAGKTFDVLPEIAAQCIGCDLAYSAGPRSDYAVLVRMALGVDGAVYVTDFWRGQLAPDQYLPELITWRDRYPGVKIYSYMSGPERGILPLLYQHSILLLPLPTRGHSKMVRAARCASAWNAGDLRLPAGAEWAATVRAELQRFTGNSADDDDIVDAIVAGYDILVSYAVSAPAAGFGPTRCI
jgi:hypothetical protein